MIPYVKVDAVRTPDGKDLELYRHGDDFFVQMDNAMVMSSRLHGSEDDLATLGCQAAKKRADGCVLVGGLGLGCTLAAALKELPATATVVVAEILEPVVRWNREILGHLAGNPLDDPRVEVFVGDVVSLVESSRERFDGLLMDVDHAPDSLIVKGNARLYDGQGLASCMMALRPGGILAIWSAGTTAGFTKRLSRSGFDAEEIPCNPRKGKGARSHVVWVARRPK